MLIFRDLHQYLNFGLLFPLFRICCIHKHFSVCCLSLLETFSNLLFLQIIMSFTGHASYTLSIFFHFILRIITLTFMFPMSKEISFESLRKTLINFCDINSLYFFGNHSLIIVLLRKSQL